MPTDYKDLEKLAKEKEQENWRFRKFLKFYDDLSDDELDQLVFKITEKVSSKIDCMNCARCCKELRPMLSQKDQQRLAIKFDLSVEKLREKYLEYEDVDNEKGWRIRGIPCPFLCDNKCTIYEDRPQNCRDYPYLYEPQFSYRTIDMIERTYTCPIVFNAIEELKEELEFSDKYFETDW